MKILFRSGRTAQATATSRRYCVTQSEHMRPKMRVWRSPKTGPGYVWKVDVPWAGVYSFTRWVTAMAFVKREADHG